jgi:hypothetical protein
MTITIPDANYVEFKRLFLLTYPKPEDLTNLKWGFTAPLSDDQWIKYRTMLFLWGAYTKTKQQEFDEQNGPTLDEGILT